MNIKEFIAELKSDPKEAFDLLIEESEELRKDLFSTQKELTQALGVSEATISSWLSEKDNTMPLMAAKAIAYHFLRDVVFELQENISKDIIIPVKVGDKYNITKLNLNKLYEEPGKIIAENIASFQEAKRLAKMTEFISFTNEYSDMLKDKIDGLDGLDDKLYKSFSNKLDNVKDVGFFIKGEKPLYEFRKEFYEKAINELDLSIGSIENNKGKEAINVLTKKRDYIDRSGFKLANGTELKAELTGGKAEGIYYAKIDDGKIIGEDNKLYDSFSGAIIGLIKSKKNITISLNGFNYWLYKNPEDSKWHYIDNLRNNNETFDI